MADVNYVLPDTIRADPAGREAFALRTGCDLVEVAMGDAPPPELPWLLRIASADEDGRDRPRWHDRAWTATLVGEALRPAKRAPAAVVIEPGEEWIQPSDLVRAVAAIRAELTGRFGELPGVLIANRADQSLRDGAAFAEFWGHLLRRAPHLLSHTGIALDAPEFYAATKTRMAAELARLPAGALRYVRVHTRGRKPDLGEPLPWSAVFTLVRRTPGTVMIAPAVQDSDALEPAILFCMVSLQGRTFT
jgi:hypothetical protein